MRTKIRVGDKWYKPVPWHNDGDCNGCVFDGMKCLNANVGRFSNLCNDDREFSGRIFIANTKEAMAEYVIKRLEGPEEGA